MLNLFKYINEGESENKTRRTCHLCAVLPKELVKTHLSCSLAAENAHQAPN